MFSELNKERKEFYLLFVSYYSICIGCIVCIEGKDRPNVESIPRQDCVLGLFLKRFDGGMIMNGNICPASLLERFILRVKCTHVRSLLSNARTLPNVVSFVIEL